jgi:hypothetical protein
VVKEFGSALDQVDMTVGRRIKGTGIKGAHAHGFCSMWILAADGAGRLHVAEQRQFSRIEITL